MTFVSKKLDSFRCLLQFFDSKGRTEHKEIVLHAYDLDGIKTQADALARQLPGGQVLTYNLKSLYE